VTSVFSSLLHAGNTVELLDRHRLDDLILNDREDDTPLITVANHTSTLDDPGLVSAILPWGARVSHRRMRWGICTEEICFANPGLGSFFAAGKALPIQRGGSIHQKGLATLLDKLNRGDWVHVFPEGRVWQEGGTPLRDAEGRWCSGSGRCSLPHVKVGPMKWGIGKLIANAEKTPIVLPYFHMGMNDVMPQDANNQLFGPPQFFVNTRITVKFGEPVVVADLLDKYHDGACERAEARNLEREARIDKEEARLALAKARARVGWIAYVTPTAWWSGGGGGGAELGAGGGRNGAAHAALAAAAAAASAADEAPRPPPAGIVSPSLRPLNTEEDYSDHTGSSARVAGLTKSAARSPLNTDDMFSDHAAAQRGGSARVAGLTRPVGHAEAGNGRASSSSSSSSSGAEAFPADALIRGAKEQADRLADAAREQSEAVTAKARLLRERLLAIAEEGEEVAKEFSARFESEAREFLPKDVADRLQRFSTSVSFPAPERIRMAGGAGAEAAAAAGGAGAGQGGSGTTVAAEFGSGAASGGVGGAGAASGDGPASAAALSRRGGTGGVGSAAEGAGGGVPAAASAAVASAAASPQAGRGPRKAKSTDGLPWSSSPSKGAAGGAGSSSSSGGTGRGGAGGAAGAFSDEPVVEVVPTRRLRTGTLVPMYVEAPLRIKPPDHEVLTREEAEAEETIRLQLYADIAARIHESLVKLEGQVMEHRRAKGWEELRPQK
jgi:monolysocardiolipin acyltransferase